MKVAEFMKRYESRYLSGEGLYERDHSLRSLARCHAERPQDMRIGTAFDWQDLDRYREELARLDAAGADRH